MYVRLERIRKKVVIALRVTYWNFEGCIGEYSECL